MLRLGAHESIDGGLHRAIERACSVGCDALQLFVKPNRVWAVAPLTDAEVYRFRTMVAEASLAPLVGHASYLLNLASPEGELWRRSVETLILELERCEALDIPYLVLHPGAHVGSGEEAGLCRIAQALGQVHAATAGISARILLETTAGQGSALGYRFEQLAWLLENAPQGERLGVCFDTAHAFAAGYELRTAEGYAATMDAFERLIGLSRLKVLHLNDSKGGLGSRKDRHEHIGEGEIGLDGFRRVLNDPRLDGLPGLLETPKEDDLEADRRNLETLRSLAGAMHASPLQVG